MRLLNVESRRLREFFDSDIPKYAILPHTWGEEEVTFQDISKPNHQQKFGYVKINYCCLQAEEDGLKWVWVDTCCINKDSSTELSEAINSMFRWYQNSEICYIYLSDVPSDEDPSRPGSAFRKSRWFTRGWTLQELLAPNHRVFYDSTWSFIGAIHNSSEHRKTRRRHFRQAFEKILSEYRVYYERGTRMLDLGPTICDITGIRPDVIKHERHPVAVIAAEKMAWASERKTSRIEDIAYCLLGIFGVNMPLLYGEGDRAFARLQEEIIRATYDHSIFSWGLGDNHRGSRGADWHLLARHPDVFKQFNRFADPFKTILGGSHYSMTNLGLHVELLVIYFGNTNHFFENKNSPPRTHRSFALGLLDIATAYGKTEEGRIAVPLVQLPKSGDHHRAARCRGGSLSIVPATLSKIAKRRPIYLSEEAPSAGLLDDIELTTIELDPDEGWVISDYFPPMIRVEPCGDRGQTIIAMESDVKQILIRYHHSDHGPFLLLLTNNELPDSVTALNFTHTTWRATKEWSVTMARAVNRNWSTWRTLLEPDYEEFNIQTVLRTLHWSTVCEFSPTQRVRLVSTRIGIIEIKIAR
ncbi:HET-domain-containing protein [Xylaria acuta]|nr:HET-domain-containing protein [Xylaria acuta]